MAVTYDTGTDGGNASATSLTYSHTVTGSDVILFVGVTGDYTSDGVTGVTYNGVAMTLLDKNNGLSNLARWTYLWVLMAPATGAHNVVVSASGSQFIASLAVSYTGTKQTGQPDAHVFDRTAGGTLTSNITTVADNSLIIAYLHDDGGNGNPGSGATKRVEDAAFNGLNVFIEKNAATTPAGATSIDWTSAGVANAALASIAPAVAAGATPSALALLGVG
jgi:hypothetical protein